MLLPAQQRAAFEVIEAEFVVELLVLLLDGPALMREVHQLPQRGRGWQVDQIVLGARLHAEIALAQQPPLGREPTLPPVVGGGDAGRAEARAPWRVRAVAPGDETPLSCPL